MAQQNAPVESDRTSKAQGKAPARVKPGQMFILGVPGSGADELAQSLADAGLPVLNCHQLEDPLRTADSQAHIDGSNAAQMSAQLQAVLNEVGADWWKIGGLLSDTPSRQALERIVDALDAQLQQVRSPAGNWGLHAPTLPLVLPLLPWRLERPFLILVRSDPRKVAGHLRRAFGIPAPVGLAIWEFHTAAMLRLAQRVPHIVYEHKADHPDPAAFGRRLVAALNHAGIDEPGFDPADVRVPRPFFDEAAATDPLEAPLTDAQTRLATGFSDLGPATPLARISDKAVRVLTGFERDTARQHALLNRARSAEFTAAQLRAETTEALARLRALEDAIAEKDMCIADLAAREQGLREKLSETESEFETLKYKASKDQEKITELEGTIGQLERVRDQVADDLARVRASAESQIAEHRQEIQEILSEAEALRTALRSERERNDEIKDRADRAETLAADIERLEAEKTGLKESVRQGQRKANIAWAERLQLATANDRMREEIRQLREDLEAAGRDRSRSAAKDQAAQPSLLSGGRIDTYASSASGEDRKRSSSADSTNRQTSLFGSLRSALNRFSGQSKGSRADRLLEHMLFDADWYVEQNPKIKTLDITLAGHYIAEGAEQGLKPHPLFDPAWYLSQLPHSLTDKTPLEHYLDADPASAASPHPLINRAFIQGQISNALPSDRPLLVSLLSDPSLRQIGTHPLFDSKWYLATNPDVAEAGVHPLDHYLRSGAAEGRAPNPEFDPDRYRRDHGIGPEINPLVHHVMAMGSENASGGTAP